MVLRSRRHRSYLLSSAKRHTVGPQTSKSKHWRKIEQRTKYAKVVCESRQALINCFPLSQLLILTGSLWSSNRISFRISNFSSFKKPSQGCRPLPCRSMAVAWALCQGPGSHNGSWKMRVLANGSLSALRLWPEVSRSRVPNLKQNLAKMPSEACRTQAAACML